MRYAQKSVRQMRPLTEQAQQTLPKSVDNTVASVGDLVQAKGANLSALQSGTPVNFHQIFQQSKNVEAVVQQMHGRQRAANQQQAAAQSQILSDAKGSAHADHHDLRLCHRASRGHRLLTAHRLGPTGHVYTYALSALTQCLRLHETHR